MTEGRDPKITLRVPQELLGRLDDHADRAGTNRSEIARRHLWYAVETQDGPIDHEGESRESVEEIIEQNRILRMCLPSKWRTHLENLFADHIRDRFSPNDLRTMGDAYRDQAEEMEELASSHPLAPDADLVAIVDDVLLDALQAADLSNYYEGVENVFEKRFEGVEDGRRERETLVSILQQTVETHRSLAAALKSDRTPTVRAENLPAQCDQALPEGVTREDVARLATQLVEQDVPAEAVPEVIPTSDPSLDTMDIESVVDEVDVEADDEAIITMGGQLQTTPDESNDDQDDDPLPVRSVEEQQQRIADALPAADGGRDPRSVPGKRGCDIMKPTNTDNTESIDHDNIEDASTTLDELADAAEKAAKKGGESDA